MFETKPPHSPEENESENLTDEHKGKSHKTKRYLSNKTWTNTQGPKLESETNFKGQCSYLEGYIFNLGMRAAENSTRMMKDLESYLGSTYSNICQPSIMTKTPETSPEPDMPTITPDTKSSDPI